MGNVSSRTATRGGSSRSEAMADRRKSNAAFLRTVPRERSIARLQFPRRINATEAGTPEYDAMPSDVKAMRDNYAPNSIDTTALDTRDGSRAVSSGAAQDNFLLGRHFPNNVVGAAALASLEGNRAVGQAHIQTNALIGRHFPANVVDSVVLAGIEGNRAVGGAHIQTNALLARHFPRENNEDILPPGVRVRVSQLPEIWELRGNLGAERVPPLGGLRGKVRRGQIESRLNGDTLLKDGTLPISALASRPWPSSFEFRLHGRRIKDLEEQNKSQAKRLSSLENKAHIHVV